MVERAIYNRLMVVQLHHRLLIIRRVGCKPVVFSQRVKMGYWGLRDDMIISYLLKVYDNTTMNKQDAIEEIRNRFTSWSEFDEFMNDDPGWNSK